MKQHRAILLALTIGIASGSFITFLMYKRNAVEFYKRALKRVPHGYLVVESKESLNSKLSIKLQSSYGSNSGDDIKYYSGAGATSQFGTIAFGYPTTDIPRFGDIIIVRFDLPDGTTKTMVVSNGEYGVLFENNQFIVSYLQNDKNVQKRA